MHHPTALTGKIVAAPELREANGTTLTTFRIAHQGQAGHSRSPRFVTCSARGSAAQNAAKLINLDAHVRVTGHLVRESTSNKRSICRIEATKIDLLQDDGRWIQAEAFNTDDATQYNGPTLHQPL